MGEEIQYSHFNKADYQQFDTHLKKETELLKSWFEQNSFSRKPLNAGYELEAWLINHQGKPLAINESFLQRAANPLLSPELAKFNIELNVEPESLTGKVLSIFEQRLDRLWKECADTASSLDSEIIGICLLYTSDAADERG